MNRKPYRKASQLALRVALAAGFLSAVADRFGIWGPPGADNVAWGAWDNFQAYANQLNWFLTSPLAIAAAWTATAAEVALAAALLVGFRLRLTAFASGALLLAFALTMTMALGVKAPLDFSVFTAAAGAFLLAAAPEPLATKGV